MTLDIDQRMLMQISWVFGRKAHGVLPNQTVYVPSSSASLLPGEMFYIQYGDGSASEGSVYSDSLTIGGTTVQKQAIEVAAGSTGDFYQSDGLVGLGFDVLNSGMLRLPLSDPDVSSFPPLVPLSLLPH